MAVNYKFKTTPYDHQRTALERSVGRRGYAYLAEMGAGKSKMLIDDLGRLYLEGQINFALIIAPKGVYRNWVAKEIPTHMSDEVTHRVIQWVAAPNKKQQAEMQSVKDKFDGLTIFVMNVEAFSTVKGKQAGEWLAKKFGPTGAIGIDESTTIKNHKAKRTKALCKIAAGFSYRRIMTGSPITKNPMDAYAQFEFLGPGTLGFESYYAFQARYAVIQQRKMGAHSFQQVIGYRNLDELTDRLARYSFRVLKKDCLDLPEKTYTVRYVGMTDEQYRMYEQIRNTAMTLVENNELVTAPAVITQMLRLQQVLSGHLKTDDGDMVTFPSKRMEALQEVLEEHDGKAIIWSRFRYDIQSIVEMLNKTFGEGCAAAYYGDTSDDERQRIVSDFQNPNHPLRFFVSNKTGAYGITLTEANLVVYYANDFDLETRIQSEDRAHRIGQRNPVTYVDLITERSIDEKIVEALRNKIDLGAKVLGEQAREWLQIKPSKG
jgi:SNF2 family DNA or RNA helicase